MPSVFHRDIRALRTPISLNVLDKIHPGHPSPWPQGLMTALGQAPSPCLSYVVGVLISSPTFAYICSCFSLPWPWCITCCVGGCWWTPLPGPSTACCAQTLPCQWGHCPCWDHPSLPACALGWEWANMIKAAIYSSPWELISTTALLRTEKYTGMSFFLSSFFLLTMFSNCQCCHDIQKAQKVTSFLEQLSPG